MMTPQGFDLLVEREGSEKIAYPDPKSALAKACYARNINPLNYGYRRLEGWQGHAGIPWTIGIGHTGPEVHEGLEWTDAQIKQAFATDIAKFERAVDACVKVPLQPYQRDALVSFSHNCGEFSLAHGGNNGGPSSILRALNSGDYAGAAEAFNNWMADPELRTRRAGEREQFKGTHFVAQYVG